ncbi:MAG: Bcr/CflA family efflux MFS transporter [Rubrivivax sp.]|nr:Bcr/CflA family efflux MFS transporter [Rubrivivax sp.]
MSASPAAPSPARRPPRLFTLALLTALAALTLNMILPSLPSMARDLGARESAVALAISGYMLASAVFQLSMGPLSDRYGRRPVMLAALATYAVASAGCLLASDVGTLLAWRLVQAVVVAGTVVTSAAIRDQYGAADAASRLGAISTSMAVAPMLGPMLGGVLDAAFGWRSVFALYAALGVALLVLVWRDMGETRRPGLPPPRLRDGAALLGSARWWAYVLCGAFSVGAFFVFVTGVPYVASARWQLSSAEIGLGVGSITGGFMVGAAITARYATRLGMATLILSGRWVSVATLLLALALFGWGVAHPMALFAPTLLVGLGNGLTLANVNAGALSVRPDLAGTAAGFAGAMWVALGAVLSTLTALVVERWNSPSVLLGLMLFCVAASLAAALVAVRRAPASA